MKVDDWGVWYLLAPFGGSNDQRKGMRWTLLETGSWISPGEWHSMSGVNRLVCDVACTGGEKEGASAPSVRRWKEQRYDACLGEFEEKRRDLFCAFNVGQDKGCVYRLTDQQLLRAVCGNQLRVLNLQTPALLDALRWVVLEQGSWQVRQGRFVWVSNEAQGHSFEPLDLSTELGRQQRALAADKDGNVAGVKRARLEHGRNTGLKKSSACSSLGGKARQPNRSECMPNREAVLKNGIILSRGKTRVGLGQGSSLRSPIKSSRSRGLGATGAAVKMASMGEQGTRISASVIAAQIRQKSKLQKSRRIVHSRETSRGPEGECESDRTADSADALKKHTSASDLQDGDNILHSKRGDGSHNKDKSKASDEDLQLSAARPKRKRTGAPVVESEEAAKVARKMARQKREQEKKALNEQLVLQGLCLVEIPADGHCLFSAINDQLKRSNHDSQRQHTYKTLRREAAKYMLEVS